jgi:FMN phosphatase YigB (HAD superfamily)
LSPSAAPSDIPPAFEVSAEDEMFNAILRSLASHHDVPERELRVRSLLLLPRIADIEGRVSTGEALREMERIAAQMPHTAEWSVGCDLEPVGLRDLQFAEVDEAVAAYICTRFHYIGQHRHGADYFGLFHPDLDVPLALFVVANVDFVTNRVVSDAGGRVVDVARVFAFHELPVVRRARRDGTVAPTSILSHGLTRLGEHLSREGGDVELVTAVNVGLGFDGNSYRSAGWTLRGEGPYEWHTYVDGAYVTEREAARRVTDSIVRGAHRNPIASPGVEMSRMALRPKQVWSRHFPKRRETDPAAGFAVAPRTQLPILMIDGCDSLWETQVNFDAATLRIAEIVRREDLDSDEWRRLLLYREMCNVDEFGFGSERFPRSCVEAFRVLLDRDPRGNPRRDAELCIERSAANVFMRPVKLRDGARSVLEQLQRSFRLAFVAQGDIGLTRSRLSASGLADLFEMVEIRERLGVLELRSFMESHPAPRHVRVGNSIPVDYLPALSAGAEAILVQGATWEYERGPNLPEDAVDAVHLKDLPLAV